MSEEKMTLQEAIERMDESIKHYTGVGLPVTAEDYQEAIAKQDRATDEAWQICRTHLTFDRWNLKDQLETWATRHGAQIEAVRTRIDNGGLTEEEKRLLEDLHIEYHYDRRVTA